MSLSPHFLQAKRNLKLYEWKREMLLQVGIL